MKLQAGDQIRVTLADCKASGKEASYTLLNGALFVEWDGEGFLGCTNPAINGREYWSIRVMLFYQQEMQERTDARTDIDCMFEQLVAEGAV